MLHYRLSAAALLALSAALLWSCASEGEAPPPGADGGTVDAPADDGAPTGQTPADGDTDAQAADSGENGGTAVPNDIAEAFPDYRAKSTPDTLADYMPSIRESIDQLPEAEPQNLPALLSAFEGFAEQARETPGQWEQGNIALGANEREYRPSKPELLLAAVGSRIQEIVRNNPDDAVRQALQGVAVDDPTLIFRNFTIRHTDVMGSGRFFYVDQSEEVSVELPVAAVED